MRSALLLLLSAALAAPGGAAAATVVNGDFESGNLNGWHVQSQTFAGNWFAYRGTVAPIANKPKSKPVQAPPQGSYAAIADEPARDSLILYQDVALAAGVDQQLSLLAYYDSYKPIAIPTPDSLSAEEQALGGQDNQQFRIDVMKPSAPLDSLDPEDILRTVFETRPGAPPTMPPTRFTAGLGAFAGQTVRLRIAVAATAEVLNAGVDAISISGAKSDQGGGAAGPRAPGRLGIARVRTNRRNGTATVFVRVPGPGLLIATGRSAGRSARAAGARPAGAKQAIRATTVKVRAAGTVPLHLVPTPLGRRLLASKHRLRIRVTIVFIPAKGRRATVSRPITLRLARLPHMSN